MEIPQPIPKSLLTVINQLYELEQKLKKQGGLESLQRNINRMKDAFEEYGLVYEDPMGQQCSETRTDVDATIAGAGTDNLFVVEVIKPIVRQRNQDIQGDAGRIIQKGIVVVESRQEGSNHE